MAKASYDDQVFINCPLDTEYLGLFRACTFTVLDCGFIPRCSLEIDDAMQSRLDGIVDLISECRYGIHDLSRVRLDPTSKLPRFNMPFELGVFYGARRFGRKKQQQKHCVILEKHRFRYQKFISDISGIDVAPHANSQRTLVLAVRKWFVTTSRRKNIPSGETVYSRFRKFQNGIRKGCRRNSIDYDSMPFVEVVANMTHWLEANQVVDQPVFS